jgi:hypothetical protein
MSLLKESPFVAKASIHRLDSGIRHPFRDISARSNALLLLGGGADVPGLVWHDDPALACTAVLLVGKVSATELAAATEVMPDPAVPIADFADNCVI